MTISQPSKACALNVAWQPSQSCTNIHDLVDCIDLAEIKYLVCPIVKPLVDDQSTPCSISNSTTVSQMPLRPSDLLISSNGKLK
jgi:hypothetical protein